MYPFSEMKKNLLVASVKKSDKCNFPPCIPTERLLQNTMLCGHACLVFNVSTVVPGVYGGQLC